MTPSARLVELARECFEATGHNHERAAEALVAAVENDPVLSEELLRRGALRVANDAAGVKPDGPTELLTGTRPNNGDAR